MFTCPCLGRGNCLIKLHVILWLFVKHLVLFFLINSFFLIFDFRERGREKKRERESDGGGKHLFIVPLIYAFTGGFLYVPWQRIELITLAYEDHVLTNLTTRPGPHLFSKYCKVGVRFSISKFGITRFRLNEFLRIRSWQVISQLVFISQNSRFSRGEHWL